LQVDPPAAPSARKAGCALLYHLSVYDWWIGKKVDVQLKCVCSCSKIVQWKKVRRKFLTKVSLIVKSITLK
jgi:hypothetical protein